MFHDYHAPYHPYIAAITIMILVVVLVFFIFSIFFLLHRDYWQFPVQKLAANSMIGHFIFSLVVPSTSIHDQLLYQPLGKVWCWIYYQASQGYLLITPYTLFMFTVERLVYIRNPTTHGQKFGKVVISVMLALPWVITALFCLVMNVFFDNETVTEHISNKKWNKNETAFTCYVIPVSRGFHIQMITGGIIGAALPILACCIISGVSLCMWCCYKRKHSLGTNYALMGEPVETAVRDSVIAVSLLNFLFVVLMLFEMLVAPVVLPLERSALTFYGLIEGIILMGTLANVREKIKSYCKQCCRRGGESKPVHYDTKDGDNVDLE